MQGETQESGADMKRKVPGDPQPPAQILDPVKLKQKEEADAIRLEKMVPGLEEKLTELEDEVEKVTILAAPLAMEAVEELQDLQLSAIRETERAVKVALNVSGMARREFERRQKECEAFAPGAKSLASDQLGKLFERLDASQAKLDEHKTVRKDHELAIAAEKLLVELAGKLANVEMDCEKACVMSEPLAKALDREDEEVSAAEVRETKEALRVAQATLAPTARLISGKTVGLKGPVKSKMLELQSRAEASQSMLDKAQRTVDEAQSRAAAAPIMRQAEERVAVIEDILSKMRETEAPFLMGIESMPPDEAAVALVGMEKAAQEAQVAIADAHKFVALKVVEVGRLSEGIAENMRVEMDKVKQQLDGGLERVRKFQEDSTKRKRTSLVELIKAKVEVAEGIIEKLKEAGAEVQNGKVENLSTLLEKSHVVELEAQNAVTVARRELQDRQQELRPTEGDGTGSEAQSNSELLRTKVRINYMEAELDKFRKLAKDVQDRIMVDKSLSEIHDGISEAEADVDRLTDTSQSWAQDQKAPEEDEKKIGEVQNKLSATTVQVEEKLKDAQGLELKELRTVFGRLQRAQWKLDRTKEVARNLSRAVSTQLVKDAATAIQNAEKATNALSSAAAKAGELPVTKLGDLNKQATGALELIRAAQAALSKGQVANLVLDVKVEFARLQLRCKAAERKGKVAATSVSSKFNHIAVEATGKVLSTLRAAARDSGMYDPDALFDKMAGGGYEVSEDQFSKYFTKNAEKAELSPEKIKVAFSQIAPHGLSRRVFAAALADFLKCVRDITMTDEFVIQAAKKLRKLELGELLEATGELREDEGLSLQRVQCRALSDGLKGWVTVRSNSGTEYLTRAQKPLLLCKDAVQMRKEKDVESQKVRDVKPGEVLELKEGPHEVRIGSDERVRGVCCHEEATGWLQVRDKAGTALARLSSKAYKCVEAIAMTDVADFDNCQMVRRLDVGEALELLDDAPAAAAGKEGAAAKRLRFRACRDGKEGWVTTDGSQGKVYLSVAPKHYICQQATPLHAGLSAESAVVRVLMAGEAFQGFEDPKQVAGGERQTAWLTRAMTDGAEGWVANATEEIIEEWKPIYKVLRSVSLTRTLAANEAAEVIEVVRMLEAEEILDLLEPPAEDPSTGQLRARVIARKDKALGWTTVREGSGSGSLLMRPATAEELPALEAEAAGPAKDEDVKEEVDIIEATPSGPQKAGGFVYAGKAPGGGGGGGGAWAKGGKRGTMGQQFQVKEEDRPAQQQHWGGGGYQKGGKGWQPAKRHKGGNHW